MRCARPRPRLGQRWCREEPRPREREEAEPGHAHARRRDTRAPGWAVSRGTQPLPPRSLQPGRCCPWRAVGPGPARGLARWCVSLYFCPLCPFNVTFGAVLRRGWFVRVMLWVVQPALGVWK